MCGGRQDRIRFPQPGEGNGVGEVSPRSTLPWKTPWRVILVADSLAGIVESTTVTDLNPPCALDDTDWIKPARASWSWWSDHDSPQNYEKLRDFVDLAAEMDWEYSLVDANWTLMDRGDVRQLARYAADHKLMVNFHGCTLPRGWSRTYPQLMSMEAVRGAECYTFAKDYPEKAPWHNTILPFTRNVVGPMDYTPVAFTNGGYARRTTAAHELATAIVFESGLLHFADRTAAYRSLPPVPRQCLRAIPVAWDDLRLLGGYPGRWAVIARRKGNAWYIAGINGQEEPHDVELDLSFLPPGRHTATLIEDGAEDGLADRQVAITAQQPLEITMRPRGGFAARIVRLSSE